MYVTRPLSQLLKSAELVATPPDGPNSGILVIQDEEFVTYSCFGCCKNTSLKALPFPQDKELTLTYTRGSGHSTQVSLDPLFFIPVLNHPLSSNRYYAIVPHKKRKGEAFTCSRIDEDKATSCFCRCIKDVKPRPLDPNNIYQQFEIVPYDFLCSGGEGYFFARSVASDGFTPYFLGRMGWTIFPQTPKHFNLRPALGLDSRLRARLPRLGMGSAITVGRWYAPFIFVKEGTLRDQVERSMYYEVTLEQRWDRIYSCRRNDPGIMINSVVIDTALEKERVFVGGSKASWDERSAVDGVVWFDVDGGGGVGLRVELVQRMKWEEERGGWIGGGREEREVRIHRVEEFQKKGGGGGDWNEFGCYVLVETFNFRRMDGSLVMTYDFNHFHHLKSKWE